MVTSKTNSRLPRPESAYEEPESAHEEPESAHEEPESAHQQPESAHQQPESADQQRQTHPRRQGPVTFLVGLLPAVLTRGHHVVDVDRARAGTSRASGADGENRHARRNRLWIVLLTAIAFALPAVITLNLKHDGEKVIEAKVHLQAKMTELRIQAGLEWRLIGGGMSLPDVRSEVAASRARGAEHLKKAAELGLSAGAAEQSARLTQRYSEALDEKLRLISVGKLKQELDYDDAFVDPAFEQAVTILTGQAQELESQAERAQAIGDSGVLLTVLLSLILVSAVQSTRRRAEVHTQARHQSEARSRTLIDQSSDLVLVLDRVGRADFVSPSVERLLASRGPDRLAAANAPAHSGPIDFIAAVDPQDRARLSAVLQAAVPGRISAGEFRLSGEHGAGTFEMSVQDLTADPSVGGLVLTAHDVTDRLAMQLEMEHRALHDELTGLPNRALLADRFEQALHLAERAGTSVGLLLLDLDRFKEVNDTFGHHYGDELLRQIGPRLSSVLRGADTIARLGGDEFAVLLPEVGGVGDATKVGAALLAALEMPFHVEGVDLDVEASIGVVLSGEHGQDAITLMQRADIAMYIAKTQNLGVFTYDPTVDGHSATKLALVGELRRALERDELILYYQPKVNITTGEVVGVEALVRWQHPERGLVPPDDFIPLAERTGLINPLTRYILDSALAQAHIWVEEGRPLKIAVNLSARNLHDEHFADQVAELLAAHDVPTQLLELEVTESAIMIDPVRAQQTLEQLSALGVRLSLDDFGAGFTSLSQLKALPISEIKIDRSFVLTMTEDRRDSLIVQSVIALGHNLGLTTVAEGVENADALTALADFGCDVFQGYHLCRPMPADAFDTWNLEHPITPMPQHQL